VAREVRVARHLLTAVLEWTSDEIVEVLDLLAALTDEDDLDSFIDDTVLHPPIVVHYTLGDHVAIAWRAISSGIAVTHIDRYRPPPPDAA
jgi:hypothetical protein